MHWAKAFRRVTTAGNYVPEIDGLRFVAIAAVVGVHVWGYWTHLAGRTYPAMTGLDRLVEKTVALGGYGVHLFFMISGFVLAVPFCKHALSGGPSVNLAKYFWRRLTRLEPPYIISMLVFFFTMPLFGKGTWQSLFPHLVASLAYAHNLVYGEGSLINNNAWSLEIEVQFYLLMPMLAAMLWLSTGWRRLSLAGLTVFFSASALWLPPDFPNTVLHYGQYFLIGILLCDAWTVSWRNITRTALADAPGLVAWPAFFAVNHSSPGLVADLVNPWLIGLFFFSALRGTWHGRALSYGPIPLIGGMCYSIYLLHARVIAILVHGLLSSLHFTGSFTVDYVIVLVVCSAGVLVVSSLFFLAIEKPCMDPQWPAKLRARLSGVAA